MKDCQLAAPITLNVGSRCDSSFLDGTAVRPKVVLVEPDHIRSTDCVSLLLEERYSVTVVKDARELFLLRDEDPFRIAMLSDHLDSLALVAAAQAVRRQWPEARILVLGQAAAKLEDNLYDDAIGHTCNQADLLEALTKLSCDPWRQRAGGQPFIVQSLKREQTVEFEERLQSFEAPNEIKVLPNRAARK